MSARPCSHGEAGGIYGGCSGCIKDLYAEGLATGLRLGEDKGWNAAIEAAAEIAGRCPDQGDIHAEAIRALRRGESR